MSVLVWVLIGIALWHFTVLLPDRFHGGIIGAFLYAVAARSHRLRAARAGRSARQPARLQAGDVAAAGRARGARRLLLDGE